ncbi:hypothetical protein HKCCE3408_01820 [Rhodobacterales bacterium HKCCE3408]|nr:hypothetical protein [Rhodobacterales bacterium HKCCE3408]
MSFDDWISTIGGIGIGFFLGLAAYALAGLFLNGAWLIALAVIVPWLAWLAFYVVLENMAERVFPTGMKQARRLEARRGKPLARRLAGPAGFAIGAFAAWLGLTETILGAL